MAAEVPELTTTITIVVYVHDAEGRIRSCLESVLAAAPPSAEVVVVDDASPDGSRRIIADLAAGDDRIRAVAHPLGVGRAAALQGAAAEAEGAWLSFVDGSDLVAVDHYEATLAAGLESDADLVIAPVAGVTAVGGVSDALHGCGLESVEPGRPLRLAAHPRLAGTEFGLAGRLVHRTLVADPRFDFGRDPGASRHAGAVALAIADRIVIAGGGGVRRRGRNMAGQALTKVEALAEVATAVRLDAKLGELGAPLEARRRVAAVSTARLREVHEMVAPADRPQLDLAIRDRLTSDATPEHGVLLSQVDHTFHEVMRRGVPRIYKMTAQADAAFVNLKAQRRKLLGRLREQRVNQRRRIGFGTALQRPIDDSIAVFSSDLGNTVTGSPLRVFEALVRKAPHMRCVWLLTARADPDGLPAEAWVRRGTWEYYDLIGRARYFVSDGAFPAFVTKRPGSIEVHTPTAAPLRRTGVDLGDAKLAAADLDRARRWDYVLSSSAAASEAIHAAYPAHFRVLEIGQPANDILHRASDLDARRVRRGIGADADDLVVFHVSSERTSWGPLVQGLARFHSARGRQCVIATMTPEQITGGAPGVRVVAVDDDPDPRDLMIASDLMVTDASPLMFDYANLARPIVTYLPDPQAAPRRDTYVDLRADHAGLLVETEAALVDLLARGGWDDPSITPLIAAFRDRYATFDDGTAADRLIELVFYDAIVKAS